MNKTPRALWIAAACACLVWPCAASRSQDIQPGAELSGRLDLTYVSRYVWRGIPQTQDGAFQPSLTLAHSNGLSLNYWASRDTDRGDFTESDFTLNYAWKSKGLGLNAGFVYYAFPNTAYPATSEVYVSAVLGGPLAPGLAVNYDLDEAKGFYASLSGGRTIAIGGGSRVLTLSGRIGVSSSGYNSYWFGEHLTALCDLHLSASVPFSTGKWTVAPCLSYSRLLSSTLRSSPNMTGLGSSTLVGGLTASTAL